MKIPHSFQVAPVAAPQVRKINNKTMQANAIQEQAQQGLVAGVDAAVQTGNEIYQTHIDKQYATDMVAGSAMMEQFKFQRDAEIKKIPVDSSVDFAAEVKLIEARANANWSGWSDKNIRNKSHPRVREARQQSIDAFEIDGAATSAMLGVQYEDARNVDNLKVADGLSMQRMAADPYNRKPLESLKQNQIALVHLGSQTEGEAKENIAKLESLNDKLADEATVSTAKASVIAGDTAGAKELLREGLTTQFSGSERTELIDKVVGTAVYERFDLLASQTESVEGWKQYADFLSEDKDMSDKHKIGLKQREVVGLNRIERGQKVLDKKYASDSRRGIFDLNQYQNDSANDTAEGLSMVSSEAMEDAYILNASLYNSKDQLASDRSIYLRGSRSIASGGDKGVKEQADKLSKWQLNGKMTQEDLISELKHIKKQGKDRKWSKPIIRQMEREAMLAHEASLGDSVLIEDDWFDTEMPEGVAKAYETINPAFILQDERLGEFLNYSGNSERIKAGLKEWIDINPNPSPAEIREEATKWSNWIIESTIIEARRRL